MRSRMLKAVYVLLVIGLLASMTTMAFAAPAYQDEASNTVVDVAIADGQFTTLVTALETAELVDTLQGEGPFTVFAPTDEAFAKLPEEDLANLLADVTALTNVLLYHVVDGQVMAADVVGLDQAQALNESLLDITVDGETVMINDATVVVTDLEASNGVIHVIDTVLMPAADDAMMAEEGAMEDDAMMEEGAMEDDAMMEEGAMEEGAMAEGDEAMAEEGAMSEAMAAGACSQDYAVQAGETLGTIAADLLGDSGAFAAIVDATNAAAQSGDYQAIDDPNIIVVGQVLCIPADASAPISGETEVAAGEEEAMMEDGEMMEDGAMMEDKMMADIPEGQAMINFENFASVDLNIDLTGPTLSAFNIVPGATQEIFVDPGTYSYTGHQPGGDYAIFPGELTLEAGQAVNLSCSDSPACFVIPIEKMMEPAEMDDGAMEEGAMEGESMEEGAMVDEESAALDLVDTAVADGRFTTLAGALETAGLVDTLKGEGPFTVFAPTDDAFAQLPEGTLDALTVEELSNILLYHVVSGELAAADVVASESLDTVQGQALAVVVDGETVTVGNATVIITDLQTDNGVIHVIDQVLTVPEAEASE